MELPSAIENLLSAQFPTRLPVWWARHGEVNSHPTILGVSGRNIVIRYPKKFKRLEKMIQRIFKGPIEIRRPLDRMNSLLWELCNGRRDFAEICKHLDATFHEDIAPVAERTATALRQMQKLGLVIILEKSSDCTWDVGPGITPEGHNLESEYPGIFDILPLDGEEVTVIEEE